MKKFFISVLFVSLFVTVNSVWAMGDDKKDKAPVKVENTEKQTAASKDTKACCAEKKEACCAEKKEACCEKSSASKACCAEKKATSKADAACCKNKSAADETKKSSGKKTD